MTTMPAGDGSWREDFVRTAHARSPRERRQLAEAARTGALTRVIRGVYVTPLPSSAFPEERHLTRVRAHHLASPMPLVFSHRSAASVWGVPRLDSWPTEVDVTVPRSGGGRSEGGIRRWSTRTLPPLAEVDGVTVTSLARTAVDISRIDSPASSVCVLDAVLRGLTLADGNRVSATVEQLSEELTRLGPVRGRRAAEWSLGFADALSESPGESLSRVQIDRAGLSRPRLQHRVVDDEGAMFPDFCWPEFGVIGEFDGYGKYLRYSADPGESAAIAVMREKRREDRLRRLGWRVVRWGWATARSRPRLEMLLLDAGVR